MFKRKGQKNIRSETEERAPNAGFVYGGAAFSDFLLPSGYARLSDNPEVKIAVDKVADLVSNMTIHLMENTDKGDKRVQNELSRKIDINPYSYMTRKGWIYKIVSDLLLHGDGNSIVHIAMEDGLITELKPFCMGGIGYNYDEHGWEYSINYDGKKYYPDEVIHFIVNPSPIYP